MKTLNIALINGRHEIKEAKDGFLFESIEFDNMNDLIRSLQKTSDTAIKAVLHQAGISFYIQEQNADMYRPMLHTEEPFIVNLYATGLTPVLLSAIEEFRRYDGCHLVVKHFDRYSDSYIGQTMF